jgi:O-antigen/teichoic acid export membrane protein
MGYSRYISEFKSLEHKNKINSLVRNLVLTNIPIAITISVIILLFYENISSIVFSTSIGFIYFLLFALSIPLGLFSSIIDIYLKSIKIVKQYSNYIIYSSLISLVFTIPLLLIYNLKGALIAMSATFFISLSVGVLLMKKNKVMPKFKIREKIEKSIISSIYKIGFASMIMLILQQGSFLVIRTIIANKFGLEQVGIFQSAYSISNNYFGLFFTVIATYSLPKLAGIKDINVIILEINQTLKLVTLIYLPVLTTCFVFREELIILLYSKSFVDAKQLLFFQLQGDFLKSIGWVLGLWLVPMLKIKEWLLFDLIYYINLLGIFYYLTEYQKFGVISISIAYCISFLIHMIINFVYIKYRLKFKFIENNFRLILSSLIVLFVIFFISHFYPKIGYFVYILLLGLWSYLNVHKTDIIKLKSLILKGIQVKN